MKRIHLFVIFCFMTFSVSGQSIFDKFEDNQDVSFVSISPKMFQMLGKMSVNTNDPEAEQFFEIIKSVKSFKVITTDNQSISKELQEYAALTTKKNGMQELMKVRDGNTNVKFYVLESKKSDRIQELLMCVTELDEKISIDNRSFETILLQLIGDIELEQISKLTAQMNLPGGKQLNKVSSTK